MGKIIRIQIPEDLKEEFKKDRYLLEKNKISGKFIASDIAKYLKDNDIIKVLNQVKKATQYSSYGYVGEEGFYKHFPEWLDSVLECLMEANGIDVTTDLKKRDMYLALVCCQEQLDLISGDCYDRDQLVKEAEYFTHKPKCGANYNPQIKDMCSIFIDIGLEQIYPKNIVDNAQKVLRKSCKN